MDNMHAMQASLQASRLAALDLNLVVVLQALLTEASVTRAARRVALSQSATSHALARLRELLGDPLLVRSGRRLTLTPRATALLPALDRGLSELDCALSGEPPFSPATAHRSFTVGMADYAQAVMLGPLLARLHRQAPGVTLSVVGFPDTFERMDAGTMDLAVNTKTALPAGFTSQKIFSDGFVCIVRRDHPRVKGRGPAISMAQYLALDHLVVAPSGLSGSIVDSALEQLGLQRRVAVRVSSFLAAPLVVAGSDLISTGPARVLRPMAERYPLRLLRPPLHLDPFDMHVCWHNRRTNDAAHAWLRGLMGARAT
jgi:DNA-binding transcriptional LysR family regulator